MATATLCGGHIASRFGIAILDRFSRWITTRYFPPLDTKTSYHLSQTDRVCLVINSLLETAFLMWLLEVAHVLPWRHSEWASPLGGTLALFFADDLLYTPYHMLLHHRWCYRFLHARHHKISEPTQGYTHAAMEHPLEMLGALLLHATVVRALQPILDRSALLMHVSLKALIACLNHRDADVDLRVYGSRHHRLHHRQRTVNFAQHVFFVDRLCGTYRAG